VLLYRLRVCVSVCVVCFCVAIGSCLPGVNALIDWFIYWFIYTLIHSFIYSFIRSFTRRDGPRSPPAVLVPGSHYRWLRQARREPQRGPGTHYRGALSPILYIEIDTPKASREGKRGERCPLIIRLGVWGSIVSSPAGSGVKPRPKMDFITLTR